MSNYKSWSSEERYFAECPICNQRLPMIRMITLKKADRYSSKNLTKLCENCYIKMLEYIGITDVEL